MERTAELMKAKAHKPRLVLSHHVHGIIHGEHSLGRFNTWLAVRITRSVGSMWCAYLFAAIALVSLPAAIQSGSSVIIVSWIAQTFFQLILLPIIIVGQNVLAAASDARAESDHETIISIHSLTSEVHTIAEQQTKILQLLDERTKPSTI